MRKILEKLWNEYFAEECAVIDAEAERELAKNAAQMSKKMYDLLSEEQSDAIANYIDVLYEIQTSFAKKAFFKGCQFATAFILEVGKFGNI